MSYDIYFTIRENKKSYYFADTLFFGKQKFHDYKRVVEEWFDTYHEAVEYFNSHNFDTRNCHIRKTIETGGGCMHTDYIYKRGRQRD